MHISHRNLENVMDVRMHDHNALPKIERNQPHTVFQTSTAQALLEAHYEGDVTVDELSLFGTYGLGTFTALDGELIQVDGTCYRIKADGKPVVARGDDGVPFAAVTNFVSTLTMDVTEPMGFDVLLAQVDELIPNEVCLAVRLEGVFGHANTRAPRRQNKPYPHLKAATENQAQFESINCSATGFGFRFPPSLAQIQIPDWHLHLLSEDRTFGGHILNFSNFTGTISLDFDQILNVEIPKNQESDCAVHDPDTPNEWESIERTKQEGAHPQ